VYMTTSIWTGFIAISSLALTTIFWETVHASLQWGTYPIIGLVVGLLANRSVCAARLASQARAQVRVRSIWATTSSTLTSRRNKPVATSTALVRTFQGRWMLSIMLAPLACLLSDHFRKFRHATFRALLDGKGRALNCIGADTVVWTS
jgi:hypothetical protein